VSRISVSHSALLQAIAWEWARGLEGTQLGLQTPVDQGGILYHTTSFSAIKWRRSLSKVAVAWRQTEHWSAGEKW